MMYVSYQDAGILGTLQGLTEFLPVSSSGHLALGQLWLGLTEGNLTLSVVLHAGTLLATVAYFYPRLLSICRDLLRSPQHALATAGGQDLRTVVLASIPTAIIGLAFKDTIEAWTLDPKIVAIGFFITAAVLISTRFVPERASAAPGTFPADQFPSAAAALLVGVAQSIAIAPGISRSGSTIAALLWLGVRPARAFELSMLVSLPAVTGAFLLEARHAGGVAGGVLPMAFGALVALIVGLVALRLLQGVVTQGRFAWFALWVVPLGLIALLNGP